MMTSTMERTKPKWKKAVSAVAVGLCWLAVWQMVCLAVGQEVLMVSPAAVLRRIGSMAVTREFWVTAAGSLGRIIAGFAAGVGAGLLLAVLCSALPLARAFFAPALHVVKATPVASFIILALVWMSRAQVPSFICSLMVLPIVWGNVMAGVEQTDRSLLEMAALFRFSPKKVFLSVYVPGVMPYFVSGCTTGLGLAWKAGIAAEVLSTPALAIGTKIYESKVYLETVDLFAWTALVVVLSVLLERLFLLAVRYANKTENNVQGGKRYGN